MSANIKASVDGTRAIIGVGGVDQMTVSNAGVVTANNFVGLNSSSVTATGSTTARNLDDRFADVVNVKDFGAVGDGVADDTVAIQAAANHAVANQKTLFFPEGNYYINSIVSTLAWGAGIYVQTDDSFNIICDPNSVIKAGPTLESQAIALQGSGAVIRINRINNVTGGKVSWFGGKFDFSELTGLITGIDGISVGPKYQEVLISNVVFDHGIQTPSGDNIGIGGGDSSIFCKEPEFVSITNCQFLGAPDLGIYLSGDDEALTRIGQHAVISNNYFYRCTSGVSSKRAFQKTIITNNHFYECSGGIFLGVASTATDSGKRIIVANNVINKTQGNPLRITNSNYAIVTGNEIIDFRRWISDGTTQTSVESGNIGGAILFEDCSYFTVTGNILGFNQWAFVNDSARATVGVSIRNFSGNSPVLGSHYGSIVGNSIKSCYSTFFISDESSDNLLSPNIVSDMAYPSTLGSSISNRDMGFVDNSNNGFRYFQSGIFAAIANGVETLRFENVANGVNNLVAKSAPLSNPPNLSVRGTDTSIDLRLLSKGTGVISFGTHIGNADAPITGYITIKDQSGTPRKIAIIS